MEIGLWKNKALDMLSSIISVTCGQLIKLFRIPPLPLIPSVLSQSDWAYLVEPVMGEEIGRPVGGLASKKASGLDGVPSSFL